MPSFSKSISVAVLVGASGVLAAPGVVAPGIIPVGVHNPPAEKNTPCVPECTLYDGPKRYDMCNQAFDPMNPDNCPANMHVEDYGRLLDHCKETMFGQKDNKDCEFDACKWLHPGYTSTPPKTWGDDHPWKPTGGDDTWGSPSKPHGDDHPWKPTGDDKPWKPTGDDKPWGSPPKPTGDDHSWDPPSKSSPPSKPSPHGDDPTWNPPSKSSPPHGNDPTWNPPSKSSHGDDHSWTPTNTPPKSWNDDDDAWWHNQNDPHHDSWSPEPYHPNKPEGEKEEDCGCEEEILPHIISGRADPPAPPAGAPAPPAGAPAPPAPPAPPAGAPTPPAPPVAMPIFNSNTFAK